MRGRFAPPMLSLLKETGAANVFRGPHPKTTRRLDRAWGIVVVQALLALPAGGNVAMLKPPLRRSHSISFRLC